MERPSAAASVALVLVAACATGPGCAPSLYKPQRATRWYPFELHRPESVDMQVFRDGEHLTIYNATATSYRDFDVWVNQRYVRRVASLPAGGRLRLSLWDFYDVRGERMNAGGLLRVDDPTPVRLVEIQTSEDQPLIGLVTIRAEPAD